MNTDPTIYHLLQRRGLTHSRRHASTELFGAAANYLCLRGDRGPSEKALIHLFRRLLPTHPILAARVAWTILFGVRDDG